MEKLFLLASLLIIVSPFYATEDAHRIRKAEKRIKKIGKAIYKSAQEGSTSHNVGEKITRLLLKNSVGPAITTDEVEMGLEDGTFYLRTDDVIISTTCEPNQFLADAVLDNVKNVKVILNEQQSQKVDKTLKDGEQFYPSENVTCERNKNCLSCFTAYTLKKEYKLYKR